MSEEPDPSRNRNIEEEQGAPLGTPIAPEQPQPPTNEASPKEEPRMASGVERYRSEHGRVIEEIEEVEETYVRMELRVPPQPRMKSESQEKRVEREFTEDQGEPLGMPIAPEQPQAATNERTGREERVEPEGLSRYKSESMVEEDIGEGSASKRM